MEKVCVYTGTGANLAKDVELTLDNLDIPYDEINEVALKKGVLKDCSVLIIPGGYTKLCVDTLSKKGFRCIQEFIRDGGGYIGICMGAYMAARVVEIPGHPSGLGIINVQNKRKRGMGIKKITVAKFKHSLAAGYKNDIKIWYQNGPMIQPGEDVKTLATYKQGSAAIVYSMYGKGKVILFSPHPEGSLEKGVDPEKIGTLKLLKNAILFASKLRENG